MAHPTRPPAPSHAPPPAGAPHQPLPEPPPWRPTSARQKVWLLVLTLATVAGLAYVLQRPHQQLLAVKAARHAAACHGEAASRPADCPGAPMPVLVLPAAPAAQSASR